MCRQRGRQQLEGELLGGVLCHGVLMYLDDPEPVVDALCLLTRPGGLLSIVAKNVRVMAMRHAHDGDWAAAPASFDSDQRINGLGVETRGDRSDVIEAMGRRSGHRSDRLVVTGEFPVEDRVRVANELWSVVTYN